MGKRIGVRNGAWVFIITAAFLGSALLLGVSGVASAHSVGGDPGYGPSGPGGHDSSLQGSHKDSQGGGANQLPVLAKIRKPDAVAATPTQLLALSAANCGEVYAISPTGGVSDYATLPGASDHCSEQALAISPGFVGFGAGTSFVLQDGQLYAIPSGGGAGTMVLQLPGLDGGTPGLTFDYSGSFGYELIATGGEQGNVFTILPNGSGGYSAYSLAQVGSNVEGPAVAPLGFGNYGGDLFLTGGQGHHSAVYAVTPTGSVSYFNQAQNPESVAFVPSLACSFSTTPDVYFVAATSQNAILAYGGSSFSAYAGSAGLLLSESEPGISVLYSNGTLSPLFHVEGTHEGSSYVTCPVGITSVVNTPSVSGSLFSSSNVLGTDPAAFDGPAAGALVVTDGLRTTTTVTVINPASSQNVTVNVGTDPIGAAYDAGNGLLYVANNGSDNVSVIDGASLVPTGSISLPEGSPSAISYDAAAQEVFVAEYGTGDLYVLNTSASCTAPCSRTVSLNLPNDGDGHIAFPTALAYDPVNQTVYGVGNVVDDEGSGGYVWGIDSAFHVSYQALDAANTAAAYALGGLAVNSTSGELYVTVNSTTLVNGSPVNLPVLDFLDPGTLVTDVSVSLPSAPSGVAFNAATGTVYLPLDNGRLWVLDGSTGANGGQVLVTLVLGLDPGTPVYAELPGSPNLVYVIADFTSPGKDPRIILGA